MLCHEEIIQYHKSDFDVNIKHYLLLECIEKVLYFHYCELVQR